MKGVTFDSEQNELQKAAEAENDEGGGNVSSVGSSLSSSDEELQAVPAGVTIKTHKKNVKSTDTTRTADTVDTQVTNNSAGEAPPVEISSPESGAVYMTTEDLLKQRMLCFVFVDSELFTDVLHPVESGIIIFSIVSGVLAKKGRIEVLLDDGYWPSFSTTKSRSVNAQWQTVGEGFLKELDFGRVWLRLNEAEEGEKDDIIAEYKSDAKDFLLNSLVHRIYLDAQHHVLNTCFPQNEPHVFKLTNADDEDKYASTVTIEARYVPVPVTLEPRESINSESYAFLSLAFAFNTATDQGTLRVDIISATDLPAADRSGKSLYSARERLLIQPLPKANLIHLPCSPSMIRRCSSLRPRRRRSTPNGTRPSWFLW